MCCILFTFVAAAATQHLLKARWKVKDVIVSLKYLVQWPSEVHSFSFLFVISCGSATAQQTRIQLGNNQNNLFGFSHDIKHQEVSSSCTSLVKLYKKKKKSNHTCEDWWQGKVSSCFTLLDFIYQFIEVPSAFKSMPTHTISLNSINVPFTFICLTWYTQNSTFALLSRFFASRFGTMSKKTTLTNIFITE